MKNIIVFATAATIPFSAMAQDVITGSHVQHNGPATYTEGQQNSGDDARDNLDHIAACLLHRHERDVMNALALPDDTSAQYRSLSPQTFNECINNFEIRFSTRALRNAYYKALVRRDFSGKVANLPAGSVDFAILDGALRGSTEATVLHGKLLNFAECVVKANSVATRNLVLANAGSSQETQAIEALRPSLGPCMSPGVTVNFNKESLVGVISEAYFRVATWHEFTPQQVSAH